MIKLGNNDITLKIGSADVSAAYLGSVLVYSGGTPPTPPAFSGKWLATYTGGTTSSAECDASSAITEGEIDVIDLAAVEIGDCVTSIGEYAFDSSDGLTSITIPNSVTSIGEYAFQSCYSLTSITIPDSVTSIGTYAFGSCSSLTSVTIPNGVTSIGSTAFRGCTDLTSVTVLATTPPTLGSKVFSDTNNCPIYVPASSVSAYQTAWSTYASRIQAIPTPPAPEPKWLATYTGGTTSSAECDASSAITDGEINLTDLVSVEIMGCVTSIGDSAFTNCITLSSVTIPNSVTSIGTSAFMGCSGLTSADIPSGVTSIGNAAFRHCRSLTGVTIPSGVTSIGTSAFTYCQSISSITIPDSVTSIGNLAFGACTDLTELTIPSGVTSIGNQAFRYCTGLESITINADGAVFGTNAFANTNDCRIFVPSGSVGIYRENTSYADRIEAIGSTLQWVHNYIPSASEGIINIYGVKGTAADLSNTFGSTVENIYFELSRNIVNAVIGDYSNPCYTDTYGINDNVELIFGNIGCSTDYTLEDAFTRNFMNVYLYIYQ